MSLKRSGKRVQEERGQMLILGVLAMTLVFLIGVLVVDFGMWFSGRESVTNAVDAAAMSGSLNLPKDGAGATATALEYVHANDSDIKPADVTTTFRCIAGDRDGNNAPDPVDITVNCPQVAPGAFTVCANGLCYANCTFVNASSKCNTIVVQGSKNVPFGFASIFGVSGQKAAGFTSAACTGACGAAPTLPLDLVMVIDRTGSMSCCGAGSDMANVKTAASSVLQFFDPDIQHVALGVLGQSRTTSQSPCPSGALGIAASSGQAGTWLAVVPLSSDYRNSNGTLNANSMIVKTINCLGQSSTGTDLGDPLKAASDYLQANGRAGVKKGIIFMTDGAANEPFDYLNCSSSLNAAVTGNPANGDGNGYETSPGNACAVGGGTAQDANSGTVTGNTTCTASGHDRHDFWGFGATVPPGQTVSGITVQLTASVNSTAATTRRLCVQLSWNGGTSWSNAVQVSSNTGVFDLTTSLAAYTTDLNSNWGHTFVNLELPNLRVRVTDLSSATNTTFNLDAVRLRIFYGGAFGPCDWAAAQSNIARAAGIEIFTIGFGVQDSVCSADDRFSPYDGTPATRLLAWMATGANPTADDGGDGPGGLPGGCATQALADSENADPDNFLCEPKTALLQAVFQQAAQLLASGSRLVKVPF